MQKEGGPLQVNQVRLGAVLSYVSMGLSTLISLIYTPIMLGRLGETEYGVYGAVGPIISYLLLLSMGLGSAYIRYYSQAKVAKDRREMAKLNGMFLVTLSLLGLVLLISPAPMQPSGDTEYKLAQTIAAFLGKHMES